MTRRQESLSDSECAGMALRWIIVQHVPWEGPGLIAAAALARGLPADVRRMDLGEAVPHVDEMAGLVVMGGPMSVHDTASYPSLAAEQQLLLDAVARDLPVLGVCLGAQLLAAALGARVYKGPSAEIGFGEVSLTGEGCSDAVLGGAGGTLPVFHWHEDTFEVPPGAARLAGSPLYANQAFRAGRRAYAFQFHVEVDRDLASEWATRLPRGVDVDEGRRGEVERTGRRILGRFFDLACAES
ncbi:MAG: gamma-glutamyl-gamma-aminobutyrate hydrolase family protein [Acidobacteria bacterium]|nr:gamma-glutamyl-gamma-aminobutyrate hydrolase family protein [Acidobacteriota bacterium]